MRFLLRVVEKLRPIVPEHLPLLVRISATDWVMGGWDIEQSVVLCKRLRERGVDLLTSRRGEQCRTRGFRSPEAIKCPSPNASVKKPVSELAPSG